VTAETAAQAYDALAEIDPDKLDAVANWFDLNDAGKGGTAPPEAQADLRRWAQVVREEQLWRLSPDAAREPPAAAAESASPLLDEVSAALMQKAAVELVTSGKERDGMATATMAATFTLAAKAVRGEAPEEFAGLLPDDLRRKVTS
jgi:hypothetical protein